MQRSADHPPCLSVVTTMYKSAEFFEEFYRRVTRITQELTNDYELIVVNDGSPDDSLALAIRASEIDARVKVVDLARNFGHHAAIVAGLRHAAGDYIYLIDIDLEERPEWLLDFWHELHAYEVDVVYGVQRTRIGSTLKRHSGTIFYKLFNATSETHIPENQCTVRLMNRSYANAICGFTESHLFLAGLFSWAGFKQRAIYVTKTPRAGRSSYSFAKMISLLLNAITSFSAYPLTMVFIFGACITLISVLYTCRLVIYKLTTPSMVLSGFTSLMVSIWFLSGVIISTLGIVGMYVGKLFTESKSRPQYLVRAIYGQLDGSAVAEGATAGSIDRRSKVRARQS